MPGSFFQIQHDTQLTTPTQRSTGLLNTGSIPIAIHQLALTCPDNGVLASRDITYTLHRSSGGSANTPITPTPLKSSTGDKTTAQSTGVALWSGFPGLNQIFSFNVNVRKGLLWQAKKGKEFRAYGAEGFHLRYETLGAPSLLFNMSHSIIFEE